MLKRLIAPLLLILLLCCVGCSDDSAAPEIPEHPFEAVTPVNPQPRAERLFGITISESTNGFQEDFVVAKQLDIQVAELALSWDAVETAPGEYVDPDGLLGATAFYAEHNISLLLTFAVINTVDSTVPDHLAQYDWDSPQLLASFNSMVDWVFTQLPDGLNVVAVSVGNEVDLVLAEEEWGPYIQFFQGSLAHLHELDPSLKVGVKTTVMEGLFGLSVNNIKALNQNADVIMLNYYSQHGNFQVRDPYMVHGDFNLIANHFQFRDIWLTEVGYQSGSEHCASSEDQQAAFYHELFTAWDTHKDFMSYLMIDWLHDASTQQLAEWAEYYGSSQPEFLEFLGTLGLRTHDGQEKNAWVQLRAEAGARGWVQPVPAMGNTEN